jgi:hypothetical protein
VTTSEPFDPSVTPGALQIHIRRELADGAVLEHEHAPAGWLTKDGEPRRFDWHAYFFTNRHGKRYRMPSITTVLKQIVPKGDALIRWGETQGILGMAQLVRLGAWTPDADDAPDPIQEVRSRKLGMDGARGRAAARGTNAHTLVEAWLRHGQIPNPADHPADQHGYIQALARCILALAPEPVLLEHIACSIDHFYAGRIDLLAHIDGVLTLADFKSSANGIIYPQAHVQVAMQARALRECGDPTPERKMIVALAGDGTFRVEEVVAGDETVDAAMAWHRALKPLTSACDTSNQSARDARKAAA